MDDPTPMPKTPRGKPKTKQVETLRHEGAGRANNPTAEMQISADDACQTP